MNEQIAKWEQQFGLLRSKAIRYWNPFTRRRLMRFYSQFVQPNSLTFYIGAHLGDRLDAWRGLQSKVIALDPQPLCYNYLKRNFGNDEEVVILPHAVGKSIGRMKMHISSHYPTVSTLANQDWRMALNNASNAEVTWDKEVEVEVTTLDFLIEKYGLPDFCKIDVEGYEVKVLEGLSQPIPSLSFEFLSTMPEGRKRCFELLDNLGSYQYNWAKEEDRDLFFKEYTDVYTLLESIEASGSQAFSGDIYAKQIYL